MSATLHYYLPVWLDEKINSSSQIAPSAPVALLNWESLLLGQMPSIKQGSDMPIVSACYEEQHSLASAYLYGATLLHHRVPSIEDYAWAIVYPCHHAIGMRRVQSSRVRLSLERHQKWLELLRSVFTAPEWSIYDIEGVTVLGYSKLLTVHSDISQMPLWERLKTELEMMLFSRTSQGEEWERVNSIEMVGSTVNSVCRAKNSLPHAENIWVTRQSLWQIAAKGYGINYMDKLDIAAIHKVRGHVWIDGASFPINEHFDFIKAALRLWRQGRMSSIELTSPFQEYSYTFCLPSLLYWQRMLLLVNHAIRCRRFPWTRERFMSHVLGL